MYKGSQCTLQRCTSRLQYDIWHNIYFMLLINDSNKLNIDLKQSAKHDSISHLIVRLTSPEMRKLSDFFTIMGSVVGNNDVSDELIDLLIC